MKQMMMGPALLQQGLTEGTATDCLTWGREGGGVGGR